MFFSTAVCFDEARGDGVSIRETELEGDTAFGDSDVFPRTFGAVVDLIGGVMNGMVAWR